MEISTLRPAHYPDFLTIYEEAFPEAERRPYADEADFSRFAAERPKFHALGAVDEGELVGFLTYWTFREFIYVEHLAIKSACRGKGIGSLLVKHLIENVGPEILLEVEPGLTREELRRIDFYKRLGFTLNYQFQYAQPPYTPGGESVPMRLMTHGDVSVNSYADLRELLAEVYNTALPEPLTGL